ncbi:MAG: hypothetical protein ACD_73C00792G0004 [uncultured bacterium]|nr:MAG: hypothetical protein ACD_73C00792G0004 [uncultured bacterium]
MQRSLYKQLLSWKDSTRRKPLVLQGARQVGKTYLLKEFGKKEYEDLAYFNFEEDPGLKAYFSSVIDPIKILQKLEIHRGKKIQPKTSLIFFDEIQESSGALNSLKYFCEQANNYHVVSAGSLLGVKVKHQHSFPVGKVNFLQLYPLTFLEFLAVIGKIHLKHLIEELKTFEPLAEPIHSELLVDMRLYFAIGGMPEAVFHYSKHKDLQETRLIQQELLKAYMLDFAKHANPSDVMKIANVWESISLHLSKENKKFVFSAVQPSARAREYETAIQWLMDAGLVYKIKNVSKPHLPLASYADPQAFKLYCLDVGLLAAMARLDSKTILQGDLLFTEFKGALTENYVVQELMAIRDQALFYWTSQGKAEVDFLLELDGDIYPLEVKSGLSQKTRSLRVYDETYHPKTLSRTSVMNLKKDGGISNYPLYCLSKFPIHD